MMILVVSCNVQLVAGFAAPGRTWHRKREPLDPTNGRSRTRSREDLHSTPAASLIKREKKRPHQPPPAKTGRPAAVVRRRRRSFNLSARALTFPSAAAPCAPPSPKSASSRPRPRMCSASPASLSPTQSLAAALSSPTLRAPSVSSWYFRSPSRPLASPRRRRRKLYLQRPTSDPN